MAAAGPSDNTQSQTETPFITPVIGIMSNEDVPVMCSANKRGLTKGGVTEVDAGGEQPEKRKVAKPSGRMKRKQPDRSDSDEEVEVDGTVISEEQATRSSLRSVARVPQLDRDSERDTRTEDSEREDLGVKPLHEDLKLHFVSCVNRQPMIRLRREPVSPDSISDSSRASKSPRVQRQAQRRLKPSGIPDSALPASDNKE